jgi:glycosyltransferase involved in cell wall biosynthesis
MDQTQPVNMRNDYLTCERMLSDEPGAALGWRKTLSGMRKVIRRWFRKPAAARPTRVLFVQDQAQTQTGSPQVLLELIGVIDRSRYQPVVVSSEKGEFTRALERLDVPLHLARFVPMAKRTLPAFLWSGLGLGLLMLRERIDLVHINSPLWRSNVALAARLLRIPVIQHVHTLWPENEIEEKYFLPQVVRFVACSRWAAERFARHPNFVPKIRVVYNAVDLKKISQAREGLRSEYGLRPNLLLVGIVGTLKPIKGQEVFLQMARYVLDAGVEAHFFIVGADPLPSEPYLKKLHVMVEELGLQGKVWFTGFRKDNLDVIRSLDILVSASTEEALGRTLIEAMAMSCPVVATNVGGIPEVVEDEVTGLIVPPQDAAVIAEAVIRLARDPGLRNHLGAAGRDKVEAQFSMERFIEKIEAIYSEVLA